MGKTLNTVQLLCAVAKYCHLGIIRLQHVVHHICTAYMPKWLRSNTAEKMYAILTFMSSELTLKGLQTAAHVQNADSICVFMGYRGYFTPQEIMRNLKVCTYVNIYPSYNTGKCYCSMKISNDQCTFYEKYAHTAMFLYTHLYLHFSNKICICS